MDWAAPIGPTDALVATVRFEGALTNGYALLFWQSACVFSQITFQLSPFRL